MDGLLVTNWTRQEAVEKELLKPQLASTDGWIILAPSTGSKTPQIPPARGAKKLLTTSGKVYRKKHWWKLGDNHLAAYDKELVVHMG